MALQQQQQQQRPCKRRLIAPALRLRLQRGDQRVSVLLGFVFLLQVVCCWQSTLAFYMPSSTKTKMARLHFLFHSNHATSSTTSLYTINTNTNANTNTNESSPSPPSASASAMGVPTSPQTDNRIAGMHDAHHRSEQHYDNDDHDHDDPFKNNEKEENKNQNDTMESTFYRFKQRQKQQHLQPIPTNPPSPSLATDPTTTLLPTTTTTFISSSLVNRPHSSHEARNFFMTHQQNKQKEMMLTSTSCTLSALITSSPMDDTATMTMTTTSTTTTMTMKSTDNDDQESFQNKESNHYHNASNDDVDEEGEDTDLDDEYEEDDDDGDGSNNHAERIRQEALNRLLMTGFNPKIKSKQQQQQKSQLKSTSVGTRRQGSASKARYTGIPKTSQLLTAIRRSANAAAKSLEQEDQPSEQNKRNNNTTKISKASIDDAIQGMLQQPHVAAAAAAADLQSPVLQSTSQSMGILGTPILTSSTSATIADPTNHDSSFNTSLLPFRLHPPPGTVLMYPAKSLSFDHDHQGQAFPTLASSKSTFMTNKAKKSSPTTSKSPSLTASSLASALSISVATPKDDTDICLLRLSVFSDFSHEMRLQFCSRSRQVLTNRRLQGAMCLVATMTATNHHDTTTMTGTTPSTSPATGKNSNKKKDAMVLGSVECSTHEFYNTILGRRRKEHSILYVTEVAVHPLYRRCGIGSKLLEGVDILVTKHRTSIESVYLHVDVVNTAALAMYHQRGYVRVDNDDDPDMKSMYNEFTTLLNLHDGATRGRNHYLLCKHVRTPTWLDDDNDDDDDDTSIRNDKENNDDQNENEIQYDPIIKKRNILSAREQKTIGFDITV